MTWRDVAMAAAVAALVSGVPSTLHAGWTGGDLLEATRAAGAMLVPADSSDAQLVPAAAFVHVTISLFWAAVLAPVLPRKRLLAWALLASAAIALLDLRLIGRFFPAIYALPFWPQFADHLAWGGAFGVTLNWRMRAREACS